MIQNKYLFTGIVTAFLAIVIFTNRSSNLADPSFFVPVIIVALIVGVISVFLIVVIRLFTQDKKLYENIYFLSFVAVLGLGFIPLIGKYGEGGNQSFGFPFHWFRYSPSESIVDFRLLVFTVNIFAVYVLLKLLKELCEWFSKKGNGMRAD